MTSRPSRPSIHDVGWAFTGEHDVGGAVDGFLRSLGTAPRLLGFGEAMHGEELLPRLRNRMLQHLVEQEGYRSVALESACLAGLRVDDFVAGGDGSLDDVMREGFSHGFGDSPANRELVGWLRAYNRGRPPAGRLRFFGFDAPIEMMGADSPRLALTHLHRYLAAHLDAGLVPGADAIDGLLGDDGRWSDPAAAMDPSRSVGSSPEVGELRLIADDLLGLLAAESPRLIPATSEDDWWRAAMHGRTAAGLLRYHAGMADASPHRLPRLLAVRDTMMADNLAAIAEQERRRGPTLVFAHNGHLHKGQTVWELAGQPLRWWCAGAIAAARLGDRYAVLTSALGAAPHQGFGPPAADTPEGVLSALPGNAIVPAAPLAAAIGGMGDTVRRRTDTATNHSYFPMDPARVGEADAIVFIKQVPAG